MRWATNCPPFSWGGNISDPTKLDNDRDLLISLNERFTSLATKLDEFIGTMKESQAEMRAENIRRDEAVRDEINVLKRQHAEDVTILRRENREELDKLKETNFMLKGAVALIYLLAAVVSIWNRFGG